MDYITNTSEFSFQYRQGYRLTNSPKDMRQQIDKIIFVKAFIQQTAVPDATPGDKPVGKSIAKLVVREAPLLGLVTQ